MKTFISLLFIYCSTITFSQKKNQNNDYLYGVSVSYSNQAGNFGKTGIFYFFGLNYNDIFSYKIDANANLAYMKDNFHVIPEIGITSYIGAEQLFYIFPFVETEFTPYTITPKIGVSAASFIDIGIGYGFKINEKDNLKPIKGFQFSFGINVPLNFNIY